MAETTPLPPDRATAAAARDCCPRRRGLCADRRSAISAYWFVELRHYEQTDDAYVQGNLVQITPQVTGIVVIGQRRRDGLREGRRAAGRARPRRRGRGARAGAGRARADGARSALALRDQLDVERRNVALRQAEVARVRADLAKAEDDLKRRQGLAASGAVSGEELDHARSGVSNAQAALAAAEAALVAAQQQLATSQHADRRHVDREASQRRARGGEGARGVPRLRAHAAAGAGLGVRRQAHGAGRPARRAGRAADVDRAARPALGRRQLQGSAAAQHAHRPAGDAHGGRVRRRRHVSRHGSRVWVWAPAARSALLPAQNATGNWIKVVQRVPVRITLDPKELAEHPLRARPVDGARRSTSPTRRGTTLASAPRTGTAYATDAFTATSRRPRRWCARRSPPISAQRRRTPQRHRRLDEREARAAAQRRRSQPPLHRQSPAATATALR